jgi:beta-N-acetylhexosaminidase
MKAHRELVQRFGQLFIMAFDGLQPQPEVLEFFSAFNIGGVILFSDNYSTPEQLSSLTCGLQQSVCTNGLPAFIATDHEGGRVQRFRDGFTRIPAMSKFGSGPTQETELIHRRVACELKSVGVNLNLAPVADLCTKEQPGAIGDRSFGTDPMVVSGHVRAAIRGLQEEGVAACVKHFPGHGFTKQDSHRELPAITRTSTELEECDLQPFCAAIDTGVAAVMTAHVVYPLAGDPKWPASLSPFWVHDVLRGQLGFNGLVITDAIEMKSLTTRWSPETCGYRALMAGADVLLYYREAHQFRAFEELRRGLSNGEIPPAPVERSLARIARAKSRFVVAGTKNVISRAKRQST